MKFKFFTLLFFFAIFNTSHLLAQDWANLNRFKKQNKEIGLPKMGEQRVVFMGNSITEGWKVADPEFFSNPSYINRGIGGQTTPQMLVRFRADVIDLKPKMVIILAGTNDIAGNTGPMTLEEIRNNIVSMAELAQANDIKVIISSVLPAYDYSWKPGMQPNIKIPQLNAMLRKYALNHNIHYLDYFSAMMDGRNGLPVDLAEDGVHPTKAGYEIMKKLVQDAIKDVLYSAK